MLAKCYPPSHSPNLGSLGPFFGSKAWPFSAIPLPCRETETVHQTQRQEVEGEAAVKEKPTPQVQWTSLGAMQDGDDTD